MIERDRYTTLLSTRRSEARAGGAMADRRGTNALRGKVAQAKHHLERLEVVDKPWSPWRLQLQFAAPPPTGFIAELAGARIEVGSFALGPVDVLLGYGDRLAIVGPNGSGKTTLDPRADRRAAARRRAAADRRRAPSSAS